MRRRQYLARIGAVGAGTVAAGCLGGDDGEREAADRTGERALDRAVGTLNRAALAMDEDLDAVDDPDESAFDADEPRELIATARDHLETADRALNADRQSDVDELRDYAAVLERVVEVAETVTDDALADDIETVEAAIEDDGDTADAVAIVDERSETLGDARERLHGAAADLADLDADRLESLSIVDLAEIDDGVAALDDVLSSMLALGSGYETLLDGYAALEDGRAAADAGDYGAAAETFATAGAAFEASRETFDDGIETAPEGLVSSFETARCQSEALAAAADHFEEAAIAAAELDRPTAEREREAGDAALEDARDCS